MRKLGDVIMGQQKPTELKPPSSVASTQATSATLRTDPEAAKALAALVYDSFQTLRQYGKEPESLESVTRCFRLVLADQTIGDIETAFTFWLRHEREMPTPADILSVIERGGNKPPLERAVYTSLCRKQPELRTDDEWAYMRDYERLALRGDA